MVLKAGVGAIAGPFLPQPFSAALPLVSPKSSHISSPPGHHPDLSHIHLLPRLLQKPLSWPLPFISVSLPSVPTRAAEVPPFPTPDPRTLQWPPAHSEESQSSDSGLHPVAPIDLSPNSPLLIQLQPHLPPIYLLGHSSRASSSGLFIYHSLFLEFCLSLKSAGLFHYSFTSSFKCHL